MKRLYRACRHFEAMQFTGDNKEEILKFADGKKTSMFYPTPNLQFYNDSGYFKLWGGEYIFRDREGKMHQMEKEKFEKIFYEVASKEVTEIELKELQEHFQTCDTEANNAWEASKRHQGSKQLSEAYTAACLKRKNAREAYEKAAKIKADFPIQTRINQ